MRQLLVIIANSLSLPKRQLRFQAHGTIEFGPEVSGESIPCQPWLVGLKQSSFARFDGVKNGYSAVIPCMRESGDKTEYLELKKPGGFSLGWGAFTK